MRGLIDIGAHYAEEYFVLPPAEREKVNFMFFEPIEKTYYEMLGKLPKAENIKCFNMALGNMEGIANMYVDSTNSRQSSSILKPKLHLTEHPWVKFTDREEVEVGMLDNIDYDRTLYDTMHIDVQGYELEVLKGGEQSLEFIDEITIEVNRGEMYEGCAMIEEVDRFLREHGFTGIDVNWMTDYWGDATYRRI
jgi:FkbM family methyltransferase